MNRTVFHGLQYQTIEPDFTPLPAGTCYIDDANNHLMTWDGSTWRDDGPIDDVSHHLWQMIRDLQAKVAHLETTR